VDDGNHPKFGRGWLAGILGLAAVFCLVLIVLGVHVATTLSGGGPSRQPAVDVLRFDLRQEKQRGAAQW